MSSKTDIKEIMKSLEDGIANLMNSEQYMKFLKTMSIFHGYSLNNTILIMLQRPDSSLVAGYKKWQSIGRQVKKGEKSITILCPCSTKRMEKLLDENGKPVLDENGKEKKVEVPIPYFRPGNVFDVSQTVGKPVETLSPKELMNSVDGYENFLQSLISISPVKVVFDNIESGAKGIYYPNEEKIVVQTGMSNLQTLKTLVHESAHARLHNNQAMEKTKKNRETEEVEAESVAYCVLSAFGFDTSDYSFPYIAGWSSGKDMKELKESLETIRITSGLFIDEIQKVLEQKAA